MALSNNALEVYNIPQPTKSKDEPPEAARIYALDLPGHRTDVRTLCLSADDTLLASASNGKFIESSYPTLTAMGFVCRHAQDLEFADDILHPYYRLWSCNMQHFPARGSTCTLMSPRLNNLFLTNIRQIAVGTKSGEILIYDLASSSLVENVKAHSGTVWSMQVRGDERALVTGSADKDVKFWDFEWKQLGGDQVRLLSHHFTNFKQSFENSELSLTMQHTGRSPGTKRETDHPGPYQNTEDD